MTVDLEDEHAFCLPYGHKMKIEVTLLIQEQIYWQSVGNTYLPINISELQYVLCHDVKRDFSF